MEKKLMNLVEFQLEELESADKKNIDGGGFAYDVGFFIGASIEYYRSRMSDAALALYIAQHYRPVH